MLAGGSLPESAVLAQLVLASLGLYHGGMALNDWADRETDRAAGRERPLPRGELAPSFALAAGLVLLAAGVAAAFLVGPRTGWLAAAVALLVLAYDFGPRGPFAGPLLLALARAGNLTLGLLAAGAFAGETLPGRGTWIAVAPAAYGAYVFWVSRLGRLEDRPEPPAPGLVGRRLRAIALALVAVPGATATAALVAGAPFPAWSSLAALVLAVTAAAGLWRRAAVDPRASGEIVASMGMALRRLLVCTASLALLPGTAPACAAAAVVLAGYPVSHGLRRLFPPS